MQQVVTFSNIVLAVLNMSQASLPVNIYRDDPTLILLVRIGGALSVLGSLFIIISYCLFRRSRKFSRRILLYLTVADLGASLGWLLSGVESKIHLPTSPTNVCIVQGYLLQFFYLSSFIWTACFAWHLFQLIWIKNRRAYKLEWRYHFLSWGIPGCMCIYFAVRQSLLKQPSMGYTRDRPWCWISSSVDYKADAFGWEQFAFFYIPLVIILMFNLSIYFCLIRRLHNNLSSLEYKIRQRLLLYIAVFVFLTGWGLANRIFQFFNPGGIPNRFLLSMDALCGPLQGFCNAVVYGINQKLRERYWNCITLRRSNAAGEYGRLEDPAVFRHAEYGTSRGSGGSDSTDGPPNSPGV